MSSDALLESLRAAVAAAPEDLTLRLHLAELLAAAGERSESVRHAAAVLEREPDNAAALALIRGDADGGPAGPPEAARDTPRGPADDPEAILRDLESQVSHIVPPMFVESEPGEETEAFQVERAGVRLADVGGMETVKARLEAAVLAPVRNPDLGRLYGKSLRGGLLLYGPPGCGKTFIARALAGELDAGFIPIALSDVLDSFMGQSERNMHELFQTARSSAPCVIFLDEIDALAQRRGNLRGSAWLRGTVNQLLTEMDGVGMGNDGVFVLAATNHPWDVDVALRRPGRLDRMLFVAPPDVAAREAILRYHLRDRPVQGIDALRLAKQTDGLSGADLAYVCESAAENALLDSARTGTPRLIGMADLEQAVREVRPSMGPWLETARNVAQFANEGGVYDELRDYLRRRRLL